MFRASRVQWQNYSGYIYFDEFIEVVIIDIYLFRNIFPWR